MNKRNMIASLLRNQIFVLFLTIVAFIIVAIVLPLVQIVLGSFQPFFGLYGAYTLSNYQFVFGEDVSWILVVTFLIAVTGGFIAVASAFGHFAPHHHWP